MTGADALAYYRDDSLEEPMNEVALRNVKSVGWADDELAIEQTPSGSCLADAPAAPAAPAFVILTEKYKSDAEWEDDRAYVLRGVDAHAWVAALRPLVAAARGGVAATIALGPAAASRKPSPAQLSAVSRIRSLVRDMGLRPSADVLSPAGAPSAP